ncbi:hypothetical protein SLNSH_15540 [Alsobacter soli]|uniref:Uncharacterized protein n=1 Tax=Alsobacter soli TaxID=2109933 RepID=A0A2T1HQW8_9HYPH|nr:hypothetical protein [Alsobacter soli]PSC04022.1 hypothetical protein SLNSH_15540 [Alsobacter soli]
MSPDDVLARLQQAAGEADAAEEAFRREFATRMDELARKRTFAYRRLNMVREMLAYAQAVGAPEGAAGAALAAARRELGWDEDTPAHDSILEHLAPVAQEAANLAHASENADGEGSEGKGDLFAALAQFEAWYESEYRSPFWSLFDVYIPERPVVDF